MSAYYLYISVSLFPQLLIKVNLRVISIVTEMEELLPKDIAVNKTLSKFGADHILNFYDGNPVDILTHCNTGSLATAGYGTALGTFLLHW